MKKYSELWRVKCKKCNNEQIIYSKPSTIVKCINCETIIAKPTGGKGKLIEANLIEVIKWKEEGVIEKEQGKF